MAYTPKPFPKCMYNTEGKCITIDNDKDCQLLKSKGWAEHPDNATEPEPAPEKRKAKDKTTNPPWKKSE